MNPSNSQISRTSYPCASLKDDESVYWEQEPLRILVPRQFVGTMIGWQGSHVRELAVSSKTKIHIETGLLEFPGEAVVKVFGSARGCAEVARKVARILFRGPCNVKCSLRVVFPERYVGHLIGKNGRNKSSVEESADVEIDLLNLLINFTAVFVINGSLISVEEAVLLLLERVQKVFLSELGCYEPFSNKSLKQEPVSNPCEILFSIPYDTCLSKNSSEAVLKLKRFCAETKTFVEQKGLVNASLNGVKQNLVSFKIEGKLENVLEVQLSMLECVKSHKDEVFCCDFKVSDRTHDVFRSKRCSKVQLCEVINFKTVGCTGSRSVELAGKFYEVHLTCKSLMQTELFPVKIEKKDD